MCAAEMRAARNRGPSEVLNYDGTGEDENDDVLSNPVVMTPSALPAFKLTAVSPGSSVPPRFPIRRPNSFFTATQATQPLTSTVPPSESDPLPTDVCPRSGSLPQFYGSVLDARGYPVG